MSTGQDAYALLDALFGHAPVGLAFWDDELRYQRINASLAAMNGVEPEEHLGRTPQEILGRLGERVAVVIETVLRTGTPLTDVDVSGETRASPGETRWWKASYYPVPGGDGEPAGVAAIVVEVTEEHRARDEERVATALLDVVFSGAPIGLAVWDSDLRYQRVNPALAELNELSADDHIGRRPDELFNEVGRQTVGVLQEVLRTGEAVVDREIGGRIDGHESYRQLTIFPVPGPDGAPVGVAGVVRDVSAQHKTDEERGRLLRDALTARAQAEAAQVRAESALADAEIARARMEFLAQAGERLVRVARDYEATLQEVADIAVPAIADWCTFALMDPRGRTRVVAVAGATDELTSAARELAERYPQQAAGASSLTHRAAVTAEPQLMASVDDDHLRRAAQDDDHLALLRRLKPRSAIVVPLIGRGRPIGLITLSFTRSGRRYGAEDLQLATTLSYRVALAVENARLYSERSHIAQTLQRSLLPPALPEIPGLELAAGYRAAGEQNEVGGDFYDAFRAADGVWTLAIGDVSGKGAEAAALTSLTRHTLRAASLRQLAPRENLELLNRALWSQRDPAARFCTVLCARVCPGDNGALVTLATGGHLPPAVLRAGGRVERLQVRGAIVGGLRDPEFGERDVRLDPGDLLLMFTDGVTEIRGPDGRWGSHGEHALEEVLEGLRGAPADEIVAAVEQRAVELQGGEPRDDIALLAVRAAASSD